MKTFKTLLGVVMVAMLVVGANAVFAKEQPPAPEKMKKLSFPDLKEFTLKNGLDVTVVEHHEQPVATLWLAIRAGATLDPEGKSSVADFTATMLN
jgi:zinc protease